MLEYLQKFSVQTPSDKYIRGNILVKMCKRHISISCSVRVLDEEDTVAIPTLRRCAGGS